MPPSSPLSPASSRARYALTGAAAAALVALVAGCGDGASGDAGKEPSASSSGASGSTSASDSPSAGTTLEVRVSGDQVTPVAQEVDLSVGQRLTIEVRSDRAGELHVHSDPEHTFDFDPGTSRFDLRLDTPGSVDVEEHVADALVARVLVR